MAQKILLVSGGGGPFTIEGLVEHLKKVNYCVETTERLEEALVTKEVDLIIVWGPTRWYASTIQKAREQGSKVPVIFIWTDWPPPKIGGLTLILQAPPLRSQLLVAIKQLLRM